MVAGGQRHQAVDRRAARAGGGGLPDGGPVREQFGGGDRLGPDVDGALASDTPQPSGLRGRLVLPMS